VDRHPHAVVGSFGNGGRYAVRLATEYPGDGPGEHRCDRRVVQVELAVRVGDERGEPGCAASPELRDWNHRPPRSNGTPARG